MIKENARQKVERPDGSPGGSNCRFAASAAALVLRNVAAARSILRTVMLAARAQCAHSVEYEDNNPARWDFAVDEARARLLIVRKALVETLSAPSLDWFTSLALVEALGAALWHGRGCTQGEQLDAAELACAAQVGIDALDTLMQACKAECAHLMPGAPEETFLH